MLSALPSSLLFRCTSSPKEILYFANERITSSCDRVTHAESSHSQTVVRNALFIRPEPVFVACIHTTNLQHTVFTGNCLTDDIMNEHNTAFKVAFSSHTSHAQHRPGTWLSLIHSARRCNVTLSWWRERKLDSQAGHASKPDGVTSGPGVCEGKPTTRPVLCTARMWGKGNFQSSLVVSGVRSIWCGCYFHSI